MQKDRVENYSISESEGSESDFLAMYAHVLTRTLYSANGVSQVTSQSKKRKYMYEVIFYICIKSV